MKRSNPARNILPTKREVIACLRNEISMHQKSYDWWQRECPGTLHIIRCLEVALLLVRSKFPRVKRGR